MDSGTIAAALGLVFFILMVAIAISGIILSIVRRSARYAAFILCGFLTTQLVSCEAFVYMVSYDDIASPNYYVYQSMGPIDYVLENLPYLSFIAVLTVLCYWSINKKNRAARIVLLGAVILAAAFLMLCLVVTL